MSFTAGKTLKVTACIVDGVVLGVVALGVVALGVVALGVVGDLTDWATKRFHCRRQDGRGG